MEELSLEDLLSGLEAAQRKKSSISLSERNTVELIIKLKELGFVDEDLLHTTNGREYVTRRQLEKELMATLNDQGGRLSLVDLPALLGMDLSHCQRAAENLLKENKGEITLAQGEVFSSVYFEDLSAQIDQSLQGQGVLLLGDIARSNGLTMEMVQSEVSKNIGNIIHGKLDGGALYTSRFIERIKCQIRGALRGATAPLALSVLKKDLGLDGLPAVSALVPTIADDVIQEDGLDGKIMSGSWMPGSHKKKQEEHVKNFYVQNHFVLLSFASKYGIENPGEYMKDIDPDGHMLETAYISSQMIHPVVASLEEVLASNSWCDIREHVPGSLGNDDAATLLHIILDSHKSIANDVKVLGDFYVLSRSMLDGVMLEFEKLAATAAREDHKKKPSEQPASQQSTEASKKGGKKKQVGSKMAISDDDDDWDSGRGKGKKGKGKKKGKSSAAASVKSGKEIPQDSSESASIKSRSWVISQLIDLFPEFDGYDELVEILATILIPAVVTAYDRVTNEIFTAGAARRKLIKEAASNLLQSSAYELQLVSIGTKGFFKDSESQLNMVSRHVIKSGDAAKCIDSIFYFIMADMATSIEEGDAVDAEAHVRQALSPSERNTIIEQCPADLGKCLSSLLAACTKQDLTLGDFETVLRETAEVSGMRLKDLDKKTEAALVQEHKDFLAVQVKEADEAPVLLASVVPLLVLRHTGYYINIPGRLLGPALDMLTEHMEEADHNLLVEFHSAVVEQLKSSSSTPFISEDSIQKVREIALNP